MEKRGGFLHYQGLDEENKMKVCIIQPAYSTDFSKSDRYFEEQLKLLE